MHAVKGDPLAQVERLFVGRGAEPMPGGGVWVLSGVISNIRYVEAPEQKDLASRQESLGRPAATWAALIPIQKSAAWWDLTQERRRAIFEGKSHHIAEGLKVLPAVARQLYHSRDLGEPFDFLTWFEYAPEHSDEFEMLVQTMRRSEEWRYVEREVDIRLSREP
jgi:hypothetical protein